MAFILNSEIVFSFPEEAKDLVSQSDEYTKILTKFDLQAKIKTKEQVSEQDYLINAQKHIYPWSQYEIDYLTKIISLTAEKCERLKLKFQLPDKIFLIKSAMHEEGNANGFTRGNYVVLNFNSLSGQLFEHELFHILARFNQEKLEKAYSILGFVKCNEIEVPDSMIDFKITNPDAPFNNYFIKVEHMGKQIECFIVLYSAQERDGARHLKNYDGGTFFKYLNKGLMIIEGDPYNKKSVIENGLPKIIKYEEASNLYQQIGTNTKYDIHQQEISADHFVMALNQVNGLPNQDLVDELLIVLQG